MRRLELAHGAVDLPAFFPDGTRGVVRCVDALDLENCGVPGLVMNAYHLMGQPGQGTVKALGGLHAMTGWNRPILTDSGGFQVFSLIRENPRFGEMQGNQIVFRPEGGKGKLIITPEKCVQSQFAYGSDIIMCLDYCTHPDDPYDVQRRSVDTTIRWARRCREEYERGIRQQRRAHPPKLLGIIQGGGDKELRRACAEALAEMSFDGYGFGGWPLDEQNNLLLDILAYTASLMPGDKVKYAMGLGKPEGIVACADMGYDLFDCVIPTREARHNRLYAFHEDCRSLGEVDIRRAGFYRYHYILDEKHRRDSRPVSPICDCHCCRNYSRAYLRHLYAVGDGLAYRLATIHNLRFYAQLMELIRGDKWRHGGT